MTIPRFSRRSSRQLWQLIQPYDRNQSLECDGLTRVLSSLLLDLQVSHTVWMGSCFWRTEAGAESAIPLHFWIELPDDRQRVWRLDCRLRYWLGSQIALPHGFFRPQRFPLLHYEGEAIHLKRLTPKALQSLTETQDLERQLLPPFAKGVRRC